MAFYLVRKKFDSWCQKLNPKTSMTFFLCRIASRNQFHFQTLSGLRFYIIEYFWFIGLKNT